MNQIQNPAGLRVLESLVGLINNADEVDKILASIRKARDEANEKIAVVGKIKDVDRLRGQAAEALEKATSTLSDAEAKADGILKKAGDAAVIAQEKQLRADGVTAAYEKKMAALESRETRVTAREEGLQTDLDQARTIKEAFSGLFT